MRIIDLLSEEKAAVAPKPRNFVAKNAKMGGAGQHKDKKKAEKQGDVKHKKELATMEGVRDLGYDAQSLIMKLRRDIEEKRLQPTREAVLSAARELAGDMDFAPELLVQQVLGKSVAEAGMYTKPGSPSAYDRDYRSSVSGMGKKDSLAYQQDGGANDEGEADAPYQAAQDKPVLKGYYFYNVKPGQEDDAGMYGVKKTKSGKWAKAKYSTSGRSFDLQKDGADKAFGQGNWWSLNKNEGVAEGLDHNKRQQLIQFLVKKLDWEANYLELATDAELIKWYKNVQAGKKPMGY